MNLSKYLPAWAIKGFGHRALSKQELALLRSHIRTNSPASLELALEMLQGDIVVPTSIGRISQAFEQPVPAGLEILERELSSQPAFTPYHSAYRTLRALTALPSSDNVLLLNDTRTQNNIGCLVTTTNLMAGLHAAGLSIDHTLTLADLWLIGQLYTHTTGKGVESGTPDSLVDFVRSAPHLEPYRRLIASARTIVVNGEGSFYDRQAKGLVLLALLQFAQDDKSRVSVLLNHSASLTDETMKRSYANVYSGLQQVGFRESLSADAVQASLHNPNVWVTSDAAFLESHAGASRLSADSLQLAQHTLFPDHLHARVLKLPFVVISGSSSLYRHDRPVIDGFAQTGALVEAFQKAGFDVCFYAADQQDYRLGHALGLRYQLPVLGPSVSRDFLFTLFANATAFVSGRWHASIVSVIAGTPPILGDANFFKTQALHDDLGLPWQMFSYANLHGEASGIVDTALKIQSERAAWRAAMTDHAQAQRATITEMLSESSRLANAR